MSEMRLLSRLPLELVTVAALVSILPLTGCVGSAGNASGSGRVVVAVDGHESTSTQQMEVTEIVPPIAAPEQPARRRLSQTITLGETSSEPTYRQAPGAPGPAGPNVTVNNNVTVVNQPPAYGGYGGFGGYGGYGGVGYGSGGRTDGSSRSGSTRSAWAPNGWEGAGRTAAPGRTPGVGGNWSPAPSHGPAPMR